MRPNSTSGTRHKALLAGTLGEHQIYHLNDGPSIGLNIQYSILELVLGVGVDKNIPTLDLSTSGQLAGRTFNVVPTPKHYCTSELLPVT